MARNALSRAAARKTNDAVEDARKAGESDGTTRGETVVIGADKPAPSSSSKSKD